MFKSLCKVFQSVKSFLRLVFGLFRTLGDAFNRWQIKAQRDGIRKTFTSSKSGRTGQREANAKADAWLNEGIENTKVKIKEMFKKYMEQLKITTSKATGGSIMDILTIGSILLSVL